MNISLYTKQLINNLYSGLDADISFYSEYEPDDIGDTGFYEYSISMKALKSNFLLYLKINFTLEEEDDDIYRHQTDIQLYRVGTEYHTDFDVDRLDCKSSLDDSIRIINVIKEYQSKMKKLEHSGDIFENLCDELDFEFDKQAYYDIFGWKKLVQK